MHDVLDLPWSELMLWAGFFALEAEEAEYANTHKGKSRPIGGNRLSLEEYCKLHGK